MFICGLADDSLQWQYPNIYFAFNQQLRHEFKNVLSKCTKKIAIFFTFVHKDSNLSKY